MGATSTPSSRPRIGSCRPTTCSSIPSCASRTAPRRPTSAWACCRRSPPTISASSTPATRCDRLDATLTTIERLEHFEGHLLNWYDTRTLAPLPPRYVSTVDSGNLAGALLALAGGLRSLAKHDRHDARAGRRLESLAARAAAYFDEMHFRFLYDRKRQLFAIGYRLARRARPGAPATRRTTTCSRRKRGWPASSPSPRAMCPKSHWFHLGRLITSVRGAPVLLSWSATMFEYLMPLLVMRSYPETLLDESCRMAVRRQIDYARHARHAVGHLGIRVHRGRSARQLSVQGVRRAGPRPEARPRRRAGGRAVCRRRSR